VAGAPKFPLSSGKSTATRQDARIYAAAAATGWFFWRHGILGTILGGMVVLLALKFGLVW
jgi:hypothetical protein